MNKPALNEVVTPEVKSLVNAYLLQRAFAETLREKVDAVYREILTEIPVYADTYGRDRQILKSGDLYLCSDDVLCEKIYAEGNKRLRALKLKPDDMPDGYCPALVAEDQQVKVETALIDAAGAKIGIDSHKLLCAGLKTRQEFIDLVVKLVISLPGFKNPLTGRAA